MEEKWGAVKEELCEKVEAVLGFEARKQIRPAAT